mmetsp:Transcript_28539/g.39419  ORF Transcript_28539/g.39419 Transcript_28539/m.39419 type:complete len:220 (+) Transcript_28539:52-711(+)
MARLPPPREKYNENVPKALFDAIEGKTVPDGRLSFTDISTAVSELDWDETGLNKEAMFEALQKEAKRNGDQLMNWIEFWNFCLKNGTGHPPDPAEVAKEYLLRHRILPLFESMTAALLFHKPDKPRQYLVENLVNMKTGSGEVFFKEIDLKTMFSMFDITGRGTISPSQCNAALDTLLGPGNECRDSMGKGIELINCDQFIKVMKEAVGSFGPLTKKSE